MQSRSLYSAIGKCRCTCRVHSMATQLSSITPRHLQECQTLTIAKRSLDTPGPLTMLSAQPFLFGDKLSQIRNRNAIKGDANVAAAACTGNSLLPLYEGEALFNVEAYSPLERDHYEESRGQTKYVLNAMTSEQGVLTASIMRTLRQIPNPPNLSTLWWDKLLNSFPTLHKLYTPEFKAQWEEFYLTACAYTDDVTEIQKLSAPFVREQTTHNCISYAMYWRIAEALGDALSSAPFNSKHESRTATLVIEEITKIVLNTLADEPWAHNYTFDPILAPITNYRPWHQAGNW